MDTEIFDVLVKDTGRTKQELHDWAKTENELKQICTPEEIAGYHILLAPSVSLSQACVRHCRGAACMRCNLQRAVRKSPPQSILQVTCLLLPMLTFMTWAVLSVRMTGRFSAFAAAEAM